MPYLTLKTKKEPVDISLETAMKIRAKQDSHADPDEWLDLQGLRFQLKDVRFIENGVAERPDNFKEKFREFYTKRREFISNNSPSEKAEKSLSHFTLFYWGLHQTKEIPPEIAEKILKATEQWFRDNPGRAVPELKVYVDALGLKDGFQMEKGTLRILESTEMQDKVAEADENKYLESYGQ